MNRTVQQWFDEPDFAKLPTVDKERLIGRYFDQDLVDERFQELPENERAAIRSEFVDANMAPNRPKPPERGVLADVGVSIARGAIGVAEMGARGLAAVDLLGGEESPMAAEVARDIAGYREDVLPVSRQARTDPVRKAWTGGVESAVTSLGVAAPTVAIGAMTGGASGAAIGYIMGAPLFGLAQYQQSYDEYVKKGVPKAEAQHVALLMGASEAGFEFFTDALEIATVGMGGVLTKPAKAAAKDGIKRLISSSWSEAAKRGLAVTGTEMAGELANVGTQAEIEHAYRVGDERFWGAVKENFGQIGVASLIFGAVGGGIHKLRTGQVRDALLDPDAAADDRFSAVSEVANELARTDKGLSERWREGALQAVLQGKAISEEIEEADSSELIADSKKPAAPMGGPGEDVTAQAKAPERKKTDIRKLLTGRETPVRQPSIAPVEEVGKAEAPPRAETAPAAATAPPEAAVPAATEAAAALEAQGEAIAGEAIQPGALPEVVAASPRPDAAAMLTGRPREANPESRLEAAPTETTAKEPWEMTRDEYVADTKANNRSYKASQKARERNIEYQKNADKYIDSLHRNHVIRAIEQGKPVPPEVLSEYPDLQPKTKTDAAATLTGRPKQPIHESYISEKEQAAVARMEEKTGGWYIDADDKPRWADAPVTVEKVSGWRGPYSKQEITELLGKDAMEGGSGKAEGGSVDDIQRPKQSFRRPTSDVRLRAPRPFRRRRAGGPRAHHREGPQRTQAGGSRDLRRLARAGGAARVDAARHTGRRQRLADARGDRLRHHEVPEPEHLQPDLHCPEGGCRGAERTPGGGGGHGGHQNKLALGTRIEDALKRVRLNVRLASPPAASALICSS